MPKEENEKQQKQPSNAEVEKTKDTTNNEKSYPPKVGKPWIVASIVILIIIVLALIGGMIKLNDQRQGFYNHGGTYIFSRGGMPHMNSSFYYSSSDSNDTTTTTTSVISGVVTAVNGSSFDVGGGGTKTTVKTDGNTTWNTTDKKVSVNDSVIVYGTVLDKTFTAISVQISNI